MAIINCGSCGKQHSNKAPSCPHCGFDPKAGTEDLDKLEAKKRRERLYRQNMLQMIAVVILLIGGYLWWVGRNDLESWQLQYGRLIMVGSIVLYAYARGRQLWDKVFSK